MILVDPIFYIAIFVLGLILGSFLNSWIWRRWENIPLLSFIFLRGVCHTCKRKISWQ